MYQMCQLLFFVAIFVTIFWSPCRKDGQLWILPRQQCKLIISQINIKVLDIIIVHILTLLSLLFIFEPTKVALCARAALAKGVSRILIVDWDVHHGQVGHF